MNETRFTVICTNTDGCWVVDWSIPHPIEPDHFMVVGYGGAAECLDLCDALTKVFASGVTLEKYWVANAFALGGTPEWYDARGEVVQRGD